MTIRNPRWAPVVGRSWCFVHSCWESVFENNYRVCGECGHSFFTERALALAYNELLWDLYCRYKNDRDAPMVMPEVVDEADKISSCPWCSEIW